MADKLHVNPDTGYVGKCTATVKDCQFGESNHFENPLEAVRHAEKIIEENVSQSQKSLKKRKQSNMKMNLSESDTIVDKVDLDSLRNNVITYDQKMLDEGYLRGETVQDIRDNLIKQYDEVSYAVNLREKLENQYPNSGYEIIIVNKDGKDTPYLEFIRTKFDDNQETKTLGLTDREKISSGEYKNYDWDIDDESGDEISFSADYERYSLSDDELKELEDFKVKQLLDDKMKLVSDEKLPHWVVLPKQAHKSGNNYKNERITDGDVKHARYILDEAKSSKNKKEQFTQEIEMLKNKREGFAVEFANKLNSSDEDINSISSTYSKRIEGLTRSISKKQNALKNLPDHEEKIAKAEKNLQETKDKHLAYKEEVFVYHLSRYHPDFTSNRKLALNVAEKWLEDNRDNFKKPSDLNVILEKNEVRSEGFYEGLLY